RLERQLLQISVAESGLGCTAPRNREQRFGGVDAAHASTARCCHSRRQARSAAGIEIACARHDARSLENRFVNGHENALLNARPIVRARTPQASIGLGGSWLQSVEHGRASRIERDALLHVCAEGRSDTRGDGHALAERLHHHAAVLCGGNKHLQLLRVSLVRGLHPDPALHSLEADRHVAIDEQRAANVHLGSHFDRESAQSDAQAIGNDPDGRIEAARDGCAQHVPRIGQVVVAPDRLVYAEGPLDAVSRAGQGGAAERIRAAAGSSCAIGDERFVRDAAITLAQRILALLYDAWRFIHGRSPCCAVVVASMRQRAATVMGLAPCPTFHFASKKAVFGAPAPVCANRGRQSRTSSALRATTIAWARCATPSLEKMLEMWLRTVFSEMSSC